MQKKRMVKMNYFDVKKQIHDINFRTEGDYNIVLHFDEEDTITTSISYDKISCSWIRTNNHKLTVTEFNDHSFCADINNSTAFLKNLYEVNEILKRYNLSKLFMKIRNKSISIYRTIFKYKFGL